MGRHKTALLGLALVSGALLLGACGRAVEASGSVSQGPATGEAVKIVMEDNEFRPAAIRAGAGEAVTFEVTNKGDADHNFVIPKMDVSTGTLEPGKVATATFVMPDTATEFVCTFHGGMKGELRPEEA